MILKKTIVVSLAIFLSSSLLLSQSLVELVKKEKERRERLTGKSSIIVTNDDLKRVRRDEAIGSAFLETQPQQSLDLPPARKIPAQKITPAQRAENLDQADQIDTSGYTQNFANQVLDSTQFVQNPEFALDKPDGQFAEIPILGILDLEINAKNGPGADIIIYGRQAGAKEMMPGGAEEGGIPFEAFAYGYWQGYWYGVLGMEERGDWMAIGQGTGTNSQEKFDIGSLRSLKKIRIIFKPHNNADLGVRFYRGQPGESLFGIDAIEALHQ
ncbi:MAG: hypothetical protein OEY18_02225 [Candidatus Aminicenantes bacterium]|nr:hypothetical protein [Candidatus Aminicenantes bacterium]MDH5383498.1 hypothetical protein [Candidatus Aminicenantes bacterium]MDH5743395.1 hypothetical protein [Candidatus Aminicenantes bacterium]